MRYDVQRDWKWADKHMPAVKRVLVANSMHAISVVDVSGTYQDLKLATDVVIINSDRGNVAVRVRRNKYYGRWRDLTLRAKRISGAETELAKIKAGACDWYFYGWSDGNDLADTRGVVIDWLFVDLNRLRDTDLLDDQHIKWNDDNRTGFITLSDWKLRQAGCLMAEMVGSPNAVYAWSGQCSLCRQRIGGGGVGYVSPVSQDGHICLVCSAKSHIEIELMRILTEEAVFGEVLDEA